MSSLKVRDSSLKAIRRHLQSSKSDALAIDVEVASTYLELLEEQWIRFSKAQQEVELSCGEENLEVEEQSRIQGEGWYTLAKGNFKRILALHKLPTPQVTQIAPAAISLPKLQLPTFSGDPTKWLPFHDAFGAIVHNNTSLANGQKLQYLRDCLKGEALDLVSSLAVCDKNYKEAWDLLNARYKVMRIMVDRHINALMTVERATKDSAKAIRQVLDAMLQHIGALRALGRSVEFWDDWLVHLAVSKLATETRKQWELSLLTDSVPSFDTLREFLETRSRSLEMVPSPTPIAKTAAKNVLHTTCQPPHKRIDTCMYCNEEHKIYTCPAFNRLNANDRREFVQKQNACFNCLSKGHILVNCQSSSSCRTCQRRHHTMLHYNNAHTTPATPVKGKPEQCCNVASHLADTERVVLLATAEIRLRDHAGCWQPARALLDNGSHASFISEACVQRLRLPRTASSIQVTGIGSSQGGRVKGQVEVNVSPRSRESVFHVSALILGKITNDIPTACVPEAPWPHLRNLPLADPKFSKPGPIDVLIGMDQMDRFLLNGLKKGQDGTPMAQSTAFGWVLFGNVTPPQRQFASVSALHCDTQLTELLTKFWELEEMQLRKFYTPEETYCEKFYEDTTQRAEDGRFIVRLPFKKEVQLGESRNAAVRALLRMEKRFANDKQLHGEYCKFMKELLDLGHMEPATTTPQNAYYMPHHAVLKATSSTTKLRVVFNASMKTSSGHSLNDALMIGPQLQHDLFSTLARFRTHRYGLIADIEKMYRQIRVADQDVDYQRIVWREQSSEPLRDYRLLRVTYGVAAASHLAVKSLHRAALHAGDSFRDVAKVVLSDFYMDDLLTGSDTLHELASLQADLSQVLAQSGFELRKWATNCESLAARIPHTSQQVSHLLAQGNDIRTLGCIWNINDDSLSIAFTPEELPSKLTKRVFLSDTSKIFDPLGLVAPCTIRSKIWMQKIWRTNIDWDEPISLDIAADWLAHRRELLKLSSLRLSRWIGTNATTETEFHLFTDASEAAYASAIYCRTEMPDHEVKVVLIAAKTKVAPLKTISLPRLELCAAQLGAKLVRQIQASFGHKLEQLYAWTDSMVTLAWLQGLPSRWSVFVANRVADVQDVLPAAHWRHVPSEHNPADCASRGLTPSQLLVHPSWWHGPSWLREGDRVWLQPSTRHDTELEQKVSKTISHLTQAAVEWDLLTRFHSYNKLKRVAAYVIRFAHNSRVPSRTSSTGTRYTGLLTSAEICKAEAMLVRYTQSNAFAQEISTSRLNKPIPLRSSLVRLQPFLDDEGVLRVGGRLRNTLCSSDVKHPIILPKNSSLAKIIAAEVHLAMLHAGPQLMQAVIQRRFWIPGIRDLVRRLYRRCVRCKRMNHQPIQQQMADLPSSRVMSARSFHRSAVDFAGPYAIKLTHGRGVRSTKAYLCSFICMSTGAMHLELAGDLSAISFIAAFKRFTNRRGFCQHLYSDNGTNFVGPEKELRSAFDRCLADDKTASYFADAQITWHFNPPSAPHMGGYWEAGIRRVKYHLKRVLDTRLLTYEELATVLTEVEACVNSRPICWIPSDVNDFEVLTPGHFMVGEPLRGLPDPALDVFKGTLHQRWQLISTIRQHFWRRWRDEYLSNLQRRSKWFRPTPDLQCDDVVIVHDNNAPPTKWKLGRVLRTYPGADERVRVVNLKTAEGELLRPVTKLTLLPTKGDI